MSQSEREIQHATRLIMGRHRDVRLFRNNVGQCEFTDRHGRRQVVRYGLCEGSSDLVGYRIIRYLGCPHCGGDIFKHEFGVPDRCLAQFAACELKIPGHYTDPKRLQKQRMFIEAVRAHGGLAGFAESPEEAVELFETPLPGT